jgi:histone deacetylase complex subunit SAP18
MESLHHRKIDREKTCPLLLRMFCRVNAHHHLDEFKNNRYPSAEDELVVYTWRDANLLELAGLVKDMFKEARRARVRFSFRLVYQEASGRWCSRDLGTVCNGRTGRDDARTLDDSSFVTGDFIDVAIYLDDHSNVEHKSMASSSSSSRRDQHSHYHYHHHHHHRQ